jgi:hypothetical protein
LIQLDNFNPSNGRPRRPLQPLRAAVARPRAHHARHLGRAALRTG